MYFIQLQRLKMFEFFIVFPAMRLELHIIYNQHFKKFKLQCLFLTLLKIYNSANYLSIVFLIRVQLKVITN